MVRSSSGKSILSGLKVADRFDLFVDEVNLQWNGMDDELAVGRDLMLWIVWCLHFSGR